MREPLADPAVTVDGGARDHILATVDSLTREVAPIVAAMLEGLARY